MSGMGTKRSEMAPVPKKEDFFSKYPVQVCPKKPEKFSFIAFFSSLQTDKDPKLAELDEKFKELNNRNAMVANRVEDLMSAKEDSAKRISELGLKLSVVERSNEELNSKPSTMETLTHTRKLITSTFHVVNLCPLYCCIGLSMSYCIDLGLKIMPPDY